MKDKTFRTLQRRWWIAQILLSALSASLMGCGSGSFSTPPAAKVGDGLLSVTVRNQGHDNFPQGSRIIVAIEDLLQSNSAQRQIAGDAIVLSQPDRAVRVSFPLDRSKVAVCKVPGKCGVVVRVVKGGSLLFSNSSPIPYTPNKKSITITVRS